MNTRLTCSIIALAAIASMGTTTSAKATAICDQQFNQCIAEGRPTYKCEELRKLCESMQVVRASQSQLTLFDERAIAGAGKVSAKKPESSSQARPAP
jgi:hypothetical protein